MSTLDHATQTFHAETRPAIVARVSNWFSDLIRALRNRREIYRLAEMSDAELSDIGLRRGDLFVAIAVPLASDPTARLRAIAEGE